jgi:biotin operon repressor
LGAGEKAVLAALAQFPNGVSRDQLQVLTGYKRSTRNEYIRRLGLRGHYGELGGGKIGATEAGIEALGDDYEPPLTGVALREKVIRELPEGERKILEVLIAAYSDAVSGEQISTATNQKRSTRNEYLRRLRHQLIEQTPSGYKASEHLFS